MSASAGGRIGASSIRDLKDVVERKAAAELFVVLTVPTRPTHGNATCGGHSESPHDGAFPRIQIPTVAGLHNDTERPQWPGLSAGDQNFTNAKAAGKNRTRPGLFEE